MSQTAVTNAVVDAEADYHDLPAGTRALMHRLVSFLSEEVRPRHEANAVFLTNPRRIYDGEGRFSSEVQELRRELRMASAKAGLYQSLCPASMGGGGGGALTLYSLWETIYRTCGATEWLGWDTIAHWATGPSQVFENVSSELRDEILPVLMSGEKTSCFGMSEPDAGSDIWRMRTRAERTGGGWRLYGRKQWTTNGPTADYALLFAVTDADAFGRKDGGITAFMVPTSADGFRVAKVIPLFGHLGGNEAIIEIDGLQVDETQVVGELHRGLDAIGFLGLSLGRMYNSGKSVGLSRWGLAKALEYAQTRETFGQKLIEHQFLAFTLADVATETLAAHLLGIHHARMLDRGERAPKEGAMSKYFATETASRSLDRLIQIFGGRGLTNDVGLAEAWQLVRIVRIADGSAEMLRRLIVGRLVQGDLAL